MSDYWPGPPPIAPIQTIPREFESNRMLNRRGREANLGLAHQRVGGGG